MKGSPFKTLIDCFNNFVQSKAFITGDLKISIALWGSTTEWFKHGDTIEPTDLDALNQFLNVWSVPLLGNTMLKQALNQTFRKFPKIENILIMCDGHIQDISSVDVFKSIRDAHPDTNFHFTGIGSGSAPNMQEMAQYGNGIYEFSDINKK